MYALPVSACFYIQHNVYTDWFIRYILCPIPTRQALDRNDGEEFSQACFDFDNITPLDAWKTDLLLQAKKHIMSDDADVDIS